MAEKEPGNGNTSLMKVGSKGIEISTMQDLWSFGGAVIEAGLAPKGANRSQVVLSIQHGLEIGLSPMQALQNIAVINGRSTIWGDAALALCKRHPDWEWIKETVEGEGDHARAVCTVKRKGEPECIRTFHVEDAKLAKLWGKQGPWCQYPKRMLQMRARGFALRDTFPDALRGLEFAEVAEDYQPIETECRELPNALEMAESSDDLDAALVEEATTGSTDDKRVASDTFAQFELAYRHAVRLEDIDQVDAGLTDAVKSQMTEDQIAGLELLSQEKREALAASSGSML